jgi:hypothetical protein
MNGVEFYSMPVPQPAGNPLADDSYLLERSELISKKYAGGLEAQEAHRLAEIEAYFDRQDLEKADLIETWGQERMGRIEATLDRVEQAIRDLRASKLQ